MGFLLRSDICQKNTRGDSIRVKVELLLQLSTCSKVEGNGRDKQTLRLHDRTHGLLSSRQY